MSLQPITPLVYEAVERTTAQTTILDFVVGAAFVIVFIAAAAVLMGTALAGILIVIRRGRGFGPDGKNSSVSLRLNSPSGGISSGPRRHSGRKPV